MMLTRGEATTIRVGITQAETKLLTQTGDWVPAAGDVRISKDGGAFVNATNLPTELAANGNGAAVVWELSLTAAEMTADEVVIVISDAATKAIDDGVIVIYTADVSLSKAAEMIAALAAGKMTASSTGGITTLTYKKRDGSATSFTVVVTEADNTRATTGSLS
jgi:hypothetical protein